MRRDLSTHASVEATVTFLAGAALFLLTAALPIRGHTVRIVLVGCIYVYVVLLAARWRGALYAVPLAIAGGLGFDSFFIPPLRPFDEWQNWLVMVIYISMGVLVGVVGASTQRRAEASERARGRLVEELTASRARLLTAGDEARRRLVRDLHDGAQQRLVHTIVTLKLAQQATRGNDGQAESHLGEALEQAEEANAELRELAHGILPAILAHGGLRAAVGAVVQRIDLPVEVDVPAARFPPEVEASAYFVIAEALTNVMKHAQAERADVRASVDDGVLRLEIRDDGVGGARAGGSGLLGLEDRLATLGGRLRIDSPAGSGTRLEATLPLP